MDVTHIYLYIHIYIERIYIYAYIYVVYRNIQYVYIYIYILYIHRHSIVLSWLFRLAEAWQKVGFWGRCKVGFKAEIRQLLGSSGQLGTLINAN